MGMQGLKLFDDVYPSMITQAGGDKIDQTTTVGDMIKGYSGGHKFQAESGPVAIEHGALASLFKMVGLDIGVVDAFSSHPDIQQRMALAKLDDAGTGPNEILLHGRQDNNGVVTYEAVLSDEYTPISNVQVLYSLREALPDNAVVHRARITTRELWLRIITPEWQHDLGGGGNAYTAMIVNNDELGRRKFSVRAALTKVSCWNYFLVEEPIFEHAHRFLLPGDMIKAIGDGVSKLNDVGATVAEKMRIWQEIPVSDVQHMFKVASTELKLPAYAEKSTGDWWRENGAVPTLFWVMQAISYGASRMTERKVPMWDRRENIETQSLHLGESFETTGEMKVHSCPRCNRPLDTYTDVVDAVSYEIT